MEWKSCLETTEDINGIHTTPPRFTAGFAIGTSRTFSLSETAGERDKCNDISVSGCVPGSEF